MDVIGYVAEEVERQGHDVYTLDGIERVGWMLNAWTSALRWSKTADAPSLEEAIRLGKMVEPRKNWTAPRSVGVCVGNRICPPPQEVQQLLERLWELKDSMSPLEFYKEFELVHPFVDGNGRTGKILLNWKNGTLLNPVFPPHDLFGEPILNPRKQRISERVKE